MNRTSRGLDLARALPQVVPGEWVIGISIVGLALVVALAVRLLSRPPAAA